jgi:large subunit ribosomal protein L17
MQHGRANRKFGRETKQRSAMIRSLVVSLISKNKIKTTTAKAKSLRPIIEKLVTKSRKNNLATARLLISEIGVVAANKLIKEIGPKFAGQPGGYTRISKLPPRISDGSPMSVIEFIK